MHILLSNDDGYQALGIRVLARALADLAEVILVAPERDRSGASNSLTLDWPIRAREVERGVIAVDGTPTDCVHLAITGLLEKEPDMVVAGINSGPNLGDDVIYSGTVAAAMEGRFLGYPSMAISMAAHNPQYYDTGAQVAVFLLEHLHRKRLNPDNIINVNVPDIPFTALRGFQATRLGNRHKAEPVIKERDPRGRTVYWVGPAGAEQDAGPGTDFHAVREGYVSVTPLQVDLTRHGFVPDLVHWLDGISMA